MRVIPQNILDITASFRPPLFYCIFPQSLLYFRYRHRHAE
nr:MAG TPA: hypothetical protein [Caudoviricetes sp.]